MEVLLKTVGAAHDLDDQRRRHTGRGSDDHAGLFSGKLGIGFVFAADDPYCGVDLDGCLDCDHEWLDVKSKEIVEELDSYAEISPSGTGVHVLVRGGWNGDRNRNGSIEVYDHGRYFAMTGEKLAGTPWNPMPRQRQLDELRVRLLPEKTTAVATFPRPVVARDDREVLERAFAAKNGMDFRRLWNGDTSGYGSHSEADLALLSHLLWWSGGDVDQADRLFRSSGLYRPKWERADYRERTIARAMR
jgi:primase-polymerase (primpol)-like protein